MLKGAFNERPPRPKYESVWRVDQVLTMFQKDGNSPSLSLQDLTIKTAMLLALTRPYRGADLAELDLSIDNRVLKRDRKRNNVTSRNTYISIGSLCVTS